MDLKKNNLYEGIQIRISLVMEFILLVVKITYISWTNVNILKTNYCILWNLRQNLTFKVNSQNTPIPNLRVFGFLESGTDILYSTQLKLRPFRIE